MLTNKLIYGNYIMKKHKSLLLILIIAVAILTFSLSACAKTQPAELTPEKAAFYKSWMSHLDDNTRIKNVAILGSHDSGISTTTSIIKDMTKTQDLTIAEQLNYGCRYFDTRVSKNKKGDLTIFHSIDTTGEKFTDIANGLVNFLKENPSEFLVLDFQHFNNESQLSVIDVINSSGLIDYAIKNNTTMSDLDFADSLTVQDMRGKAILIWGSNQANDSTYPYLFRRNNDKCTIENAVLDSLYLSEDNKKPSEKFIEETIPKYFEHIIATKKGLTVLQAQLTAKGLDNLKNLENSHNENMSKFIRSIGDNKIYLNAVNIIMRDFIGSDLEKTNSVLYLNVLKNNIKAVSIALFSNHTKN